jgi:hypothetical protein
MIIMLPSFVCRILEVFVIFIFLSLDREDQNLFIFNLANELDVSIQSIQNMRYGIGGIGKLKREKIEQVIGTKIFEEE